jgi:hypothetical protein
MLDIHENPLVKLWDLNKIGNVRITEHRGEFEQTFLQWKSNKHDIFWVCIQRAMRMYHFVIRSLSGSTIFLHIISHTA